MPIARNIEEARFRIMGSAGHVMVMDGQPGSVELARQRLAQLEESWTRFAPTSEISEINRAAGQPVAVGTETRALVDRMILAWELTGGRFDPTVGPAMRMIGYDRPFDEGLDAEGTLHPVPGDGCDNVVVDQDRGTVTVPPDVSLDPGGIGKGFAADIVAAELLASGASGALVNVGGDLKVVGDGPEDGAWRIDIAEPALAPSSVAQVLVPGGSAVATSTPLRRAWTRGGDWVHHLIDSVTGLPYDRIAQLVSVVATDAWWAEACTKQIVGLAPQQAERVLHEAVALMVDASGKTRMLSGMERFAA